MKKLLLMLAIVLVFCAGAEAASSSSYKELTLGDYDEESDSTPETIAEAVEIAGGIVDAEDEDIAYEKYKNLIINITDDYTLDGDDMYLNDISDIDKLDTLVINGNNHSFTPSDEGIRHFVVSDGGPVITFQRITFVNNDGGGILIEGGTVSFDRVTFNNIDITDFDEEEGDTNGAAVRVTGGTVNFSGTNRYNSNKAINGGAVSITGGTVNFAGSNTFNYNEASENGGAVNVTGGTVSFTGTNIFNDNAAAENGGAVDLNGSSASVTFSGVQFGNNSTNSALNGGGVSVRAGSATFNNSEFKGNNATNGGALYLAGTATIAADNTFESNTATNGGAMYISNGTNTNITGAVTIERNSATYGGAVFLSNDANAVLSITGSSAVTFKGNYAETAGGAIYASQYSSMSFNPTVTFDGNYTTDGNGGAMYVYSPSQMPSSTLNFTNNSARSSSSENGNGGAIYISCQENSTFTLSNSNNYTFSGNTAYNSGGAIYTVSSDVTIDNTEITSVNTATNGQGGFARSGGNITVNEATISNQQGAYGGALYGSIVTITDSEFSGNKSTNSGGAVYALDVLDVSGSTFTSNGSTTSLNTNYGGAIYALGTITIDDSEFTSNSSSGQSENQGGGALFISGDAEITNSTFASNNHKNNNNGSNGGGAIYSKGTLELSGDIFRSNTATGTTDDRGGAIFGDSVAITINNSLFDGNEAQGNGGAVCIYANSSLSLSQSTFTANRSRGAYGGAIYTQGLLTIEASYFHNNTAARDGGGAYFYQTGNNGTFTINKSMLTGNTASGGQGGGLYVYADTATITNCTFDSNNSSKTSDKSQGGAVFIRVEDNGSVSNCTFTNNSAFGGSENYGGALSAYGTIRVIMSTFTDNSATDGGGGIYIEEGPFTLTASIVVGNNTTSGIGNDIFADTSSVISGGYNRIGTFGQGGGSSKQNTSWTSAVGGSTDTDRQNANFKRSDFFGTQTLNANNIQGYIGSYLDDDTIQLLTLMLSEDATLAINDRATNIIPYNRRYNFPQYDQRGVDRYASGNALSIGAVTFDGDNTNPDNNDPNATYTIASVMMSGIPNTLRSIGQTASLTALIRYTNGRTAYGVPYDASSVSTGEERVRWSSSSNNVVKIDKNGNITALATTPNNSYVTITVSTVRNSSTGSPATSSRPVRVTGQYSNMNVSTEWQNYFTNYVNEITEEDISLMLVDASTSTVRSSSFQRNFKTHWDVTSATQITELNSSTPSFTTPKSYKASDGYVNSKNAAVNINFQNRTNGDLFPLTYTWSFTGDEVKKLLDTEKYAQFSNRNTPNASDAENLFSALRVDFVGSSRTWQVLGGSGVSAKDAFNNGALTLAKTDADRGVKIDLTAYLANVNASGSDEGPQFVKGSGSTQLLIIPDGTDDGAIAGTMWMAQNPATKTSQPDSTNNNTSTNTNTSSGDGSGGGGGCNSLSLGLVTFALAFIIKRK